MTGSLVETIADLEEEEAVRIARERLDAGEDPLTILGDVRKAMEIVGKRFADKEYFLPDLIISGEILRKISEMSKTRLSKASQPKRLGICLIGTVAGDIHDIGKNIVVFMLDVHGFEVHDLGIDVPAQKFVEKIRETEAEIVALSGFLTLAFDSMKETIQAISDAGLRNNVKIMIGGGQIDEKVREYTKADAYGTDAMAAVKLAKKWVGAK